MALPFDLSPAHFALLLLAAFLIGSAKMGLSGIGILAVPIFASIFEPFRSAALLLPTLVVADAVAVIAWRRHGDKRLLWPMVPWVLLGIGLCTGLLWWANRPDSPLATLASNLKPILGFLILLMLALSIWKQSIATWLREHPKAKSITGVVAGIATTLNAAGPVMILYLLAQRLPKAAFIGTGAWFFLLINCLKIPLIGAATDTLHWNTLWLTLTLAPAVLLGCGAGFVLVKKIPERAFQITVRVMVLVAGVKLMVG